MVSIEEFHRRVCTRLGSTQWRVIVQGAFIDSKSVTVDVEQLVNGCKLLKGATGETSLAEFYIMQTICLTLDERFGSTFTYNLNDQLVYGMGEFFRAFSIELCNTHNMDSSFVHTFASQLSSLVTTVARAIHEHAHRLYCDAAFPKESFSTPPRKKGHPTAPPRIKTKRRKMIGLIPEIPPVGE